MTIPLLPLEFLTKPVAHRGLHDVAQGRPENSLAAIRAAIEGGYAIEIDVQLSSDGCAIVFHDYALDRLTARSGAVRSLTAQDLSLIPLMGVVSETIPTLREVLDLVDGQAPLLVEIKDQDGQLGRNIGALEQAVAKDIKGYHGPIAVMSFNPFSIQEMARSLPDVPRGLVTCNYSAQEWDVHEQVLNRLREIPDFDRVDASFISHQASDLFRPRVQMLRNSGVPVLCWTIRSAAAELEARRLCDNVTFEGYLADK